jgi:transcriptional regulator with XRE-family HTH domain
VLTASKHLAKFANMTASKPTKAPGRFIQLLEKAMKERPEQLSLRQVAKRADLSPAYLSLLLNGERSVPSNQAIANLERVLGIPDRKLQEAAGKPDDAALEFFRKDQAAPIVRTLTQVPASELGAVHKLIERFLQKSHCAKGK